MTFGAEVGNDPIRLREACQAALDAGMSAVELVRDVLAPFQRLVGEEWLHGRRSVASEHELTATVDRVVGELELRVDHVGTLVPVICVNAEGDWHGLAGRLVALALAAEGHRTAYLGAALPARELGGAVRSLGGDGVVAITCSTVAALPGAARSVAAAAAVGCPVVVGGHAFDTVPDAAARLGVATASDVAMASLEVLSAVVPAAPDPPLALDAVDQLDLVAPQILDRARAELTGLAPGPEALEVMTYALGVLRAAVCLDLPSVLGDHEDWLSTWLRSRGLSMATDDVFGGLALALRDLLPAETSRAMCRILDDA